VVHDVYLFDVLSKSLFVFSYIACVLHLILLFHLLDFHPRILGLTGSHDQLHDVTKAFRVYHSPSPKDDDGDYLVSTFALLVCSIVLKVVQQECSAVL